MKAKKNRKENHFTYIFVQSRNLNVCEITYSLWIYFVYTFEKILLRYRYVIKADGRTCLRKVNQQNWIHNRQLILLLMMACGVCIARMSSRSISEIPVAMLLRILSSHDGLFSVQFARLNMFEADNKRRNSTRWWITLYIRIYIYTLHPWTWAALIIKARSIAMKNKTMKHRNNSLESYMSTFIAVVVISLVRIDESKFLVKGDSMAFDIGWIWGNIEECKRFYLKHTTQPNRSFDESFKFKYT